MEDGKQGLFIQDIIFDEEERAGKLFNSLIGEPLYTYKDYTVEKINGIDAMQFMIDFARDEVGSARDPSVRFNIALGRYDYFEGNWKTFFGVFSARARTPATASLRYVLRSPMGERVELDIPFIAKLPSIFRDGREYYLRMCIPYSPSTHAPLNETTIASRMLTRTAQTHRRHGTSPEIQEVPLVPGLHYDPKVRPRVMDQGLRRIIDIYRPFQNSSIDAFYDLGSFGVFKLSSFNDNTFPFGNSITRVWRRGFTEFKKRGLKNLVFDFGSNGGGMCSSSSFITLIYRYHLSRIRARQLFVPVEESRST